MLEYDAQVFDVSSIDAPASVAFTGSYPGVVRFVTDVQASDGAVPLLTLKAKVATGSAIQVSSE